MMTGETELSSDYRCTVLGKYQFKIYLSSFQLNSHKLLVCFKFLGEIVETKGFAADNTYIFYETFLPEGWTFEESNEQEVFGFIRDEHAEVNKRKSVTHTS